MANKLRKDNYSALAIHGDLRQHKRERVINSFRHARNQIIVATDVASRGLDFNTLSIMMYHNHKLTISIT
nr:helicase-related protein [Wolbachia endosymbiont of Atemnus politus]